VNELPDGWASSTVSRLVGPDGIFADGDWVESKDQDPKGSIRLLQLADVGDGRFVDKSHRFINEQKFVKLRCTEVLERDVLIARMPDPLGRACLVPKLKQKCITVVDIAILRPGKSSVIPEWVMHFLNSPDIREFIEREATGSTRKRIARGKLNEMELPVPPLAEQKRIADKLEAVLGRVDACRARLDRVPALLKRFRQSVLASATSGKLTEEWRERSLEDSAEHLVSLIAQAQEDALVKVRGGRIEPAIQDLQHEVDLPARWVVTGFDALAEPAPNALKAGPFGSALKKDMYSSQGFKIYGQEQVIAGDETFGDYFINQSKFDDLNSCAVKPGDILISLVGTIGRVLILSKKCQPGIINPRLVKMSLHSSICREFIALYLRSPLAQAFFSSKSHGGTMDILNLGLLRELPILLPPPSEQQEIVRRVEALFAFADRIEARLATAQKTVERLTPATLAKAFRGELVPQDPNDEPASELLKRLRDMDRAAPTLVRKQRTPKT
jgi:type I restriction enzyme S subunit